MKNKKILTIVIIFIVSLVINLPISKAASLTMSTSKSEARAGDTVSVTINGSGITGKVSLSVDGGSVDQDSVWVENSKATAIVTVTGDKDIRVTATPEDVSDSSTGAPINVSATGATIRVAEQNTQTPEENNTSTSTEETHEESSSTSETSTTETTTETKKTSTANLSNLGFTPTDFKGFKPWKTEYSATVKGDVDQISVYATLASDSKKAKITSGTGTHKLNEGNNSIKVVVTAEDGTTKTYTINVTREKKAENTTTEENTTEETNTVEEETAEQENKDSDLTKLEVVGATLSPKFSPDIYEYKVNVNNDVNDLDVKAEGANENIQIEIAGNKDLKDGENTITILVHNKETATNLTYQIIATKALLNVDGVNTTLSDAVKKANKIRTILIAIGIAIIVGIIIFFIARKKIVEDEKENDKYEYDEEDDDDTLDLDGEEELFKRVNKEEFKRKVDEDNNKNQGVQNSEKKANIASEVNDDIDEERYEFFRTSIEKRKGKHF